MAALALAAAPAARAQDRADRAAVKRQLDRALAHYQAKQYAEAARAFRAAYEIEPTTEHLYAWAQSERLSGNCPAAIPLYVEFLTREPHAENAEVARRNLARCRELAPGAPLTPPEPPPPPPPAPPVVIVRETPPAPPPPEPWYRDGLGAALAGAGLAAYAGTVGFAVAAERAADRRQAAATYDRFHQQALAERRWSALANVGLAAGTALVVGAAVRLALRARR